MLFNTLTIASFATAALATANPQPYKLGSMSFSKALGLSKRQDLGYQPTQDFCGTGDTCAEACGTGYITCDSTANPGSHCFNPDIKETCCPNLSGDSCSEGFYCTEDTQKQTWCCPSGMDLVACAAAYSLTEPLVSQTPTAAVAANTAPASVEAPKATAANDSSNAKPTGTATATAVQFTGAAVLNTVGTYGAFPALAVAAGAALLL